jgi:tetratricopeptide (TPR) repeat protein
VCDADVDELAALVDLSLLKALGDGRFLMLETIREYALECLEQLHEREELRRRHAETFLAFAEAVGGMNVFEGSQAAVIERLAQENDNFRSAIRWALDQERGDLVVRFAAALTMFWGLRGHVQEVRPWIETAVATTDPDLPGYPWGLLVLSNAANQEGDVERERELVEEALAGFRARDDGRWIAALLDELGRLAMERGDHEQAREILEESLQVRNRPDARHGRVHTVATLGELALIENDLDRAESLFREGYAVMSVRDPGATHTAWHAEQIAETLRRRGATEESSRLFREAMLIWQKLGTAEAVAECLEGLAAIAFERGERDRAGRLVGAATALREELNAKPARPERIPRDVPETAKAEGAAMSLEDAVDYALSGVN